VKGRAQKMAGTKLASRNCREVVPNLYVAALPACAWRQEHQGEGG
jgi:hypothetical protein